MAGSELPEEKLRGKLEGLHSIRINKQWRLIFLWDGRRPKHPASISMTTAIFEDPLC